MSAIPGAHTQLWKTWPIRSGPLTKGKLVEDIHGRSQSSFICAVWLESYRERHKDDRSCHVNATGKEIVPTITRPVSGLVDIPTTVRVGADRDETISHITLEQRQRSDLPIPLIKTCVHQICRFPPLPFL